MSGDRKPPLGEHAAITCLAAAVIAVGVAAAPVRARAGVGDASEIAAPPSAPLSAIDAARPAETGTTAPPRDLLEERALAGRHWRLDTPRGAVHVWAPADYDAATAATVAFVHGYWIDVDEAWESYRLAQQFALSGINALFIAPEAPAAKWRSIAWPSLSELVRTVGDQIDVAMPTRRLVAVGHSGAYRTLAAWLASPELDTVVLLDALYVEYGLLPWLRASPQRRLVNIVYETGRSSNYLHYRLPSTRRVDGLPPDGLPAARILYVRTDVGHWELVTGGVALPLALRAIDVPSVPSAPLDLPLGLPPRDEPPATVDWLIRLPFSSRLTELTY